MAHIAQPMDYLGVNYYTRSVVSASGEEWNAKGRGLPVSDMDWEIYPQGLTDLLVLLKQDYAQLPPVYVTENGGAFKDDAVVLGRVQDDDRTDYLRTHIAAVASALQQGVKIVACENTMHGQHLTPADMLPAIGYVPSGVGELLKRQQQGWAYVRP